MIMSTAVPSLVPTMQQATGGTPIPSSVTRWLKDLRRDTDSSEIDEELRLRVECEAVASEVEIISTPSPEVEERRLDTDECFYAKRVGIATSSTVSGSRWSHNPVFHAICNEEVAVPESKQKSERCSSGSFKSLCKEARRASESLIENLPSVNSEVYKSTSSEVNCDKRISIDEELELLSEKALSIADEALAQCASGKNTGMAGVEARILGRSGSVASELSDDVFFGSQSSCSTSIHSDINTIFDQGRTEDTPPVAPPRRKKSTTKSPAKEIFREIEVFTAKATERDIDNNDLSTNKSINNNMFSSDRNSGQRYTIFDSSQIFTKDSSPKVKQNISQNIIESPKIIKDVPPKCMQEKPKVTSSPKPVIGISQDMKETPQKVVKDLSKTLTSEKPNCVSENSNITTEKPNITTGKPNITTEKPNITTEKPNITTEKPSTTKEKPNITTEKPSVTTEKSNIAIDKPNIATDKPNIASGKPNILFGKPNIATDKPNIATDKPYIATDKPNIATDKPNIVPGKPNIATEKPSASTVKPNVTPGKLDIAVEKQNIPTENQNFTTEKPNSVPGKSSVAFENPNTVKSNITSEKLKFAIDKPNITADKSILHKETTEIPNDLPGSGFKNSPSKTIRHTIQDISYAAPNNTLERLGVTTEKPKSINELPLKIVQDSTSKPIKDSTQNIKEVIISEKQQSPLYLPIKNVDDTQSKFTKNAAEKSKETPTMISKLISEDTPSKIIKVTSDNIAKDVSAKLEDKMVLCSEKSCNNQTMDKDKGAVREDKTISSRPEVRAAVSSPHLMQHDNNDTTSETTPPQCNTAIFPHHFSLQIVDRKTYYPAIKPGQERISLVPSLSQEVKALYVDEAKKRELMGENKKNDASVEASNPTAAIKQQAAGVLENVSAVCLENKHELSPDEERAVALLDEATRDEELSLLETTREQIAAEESMRSRKGSFSSDIVAWKNELLQQWDRLEDEEELHCYEPGPEPEEWFSSNDREGRLYFFEQNSNESSWTLPDDSPTATTPPLGKTSSDNNLCSSPKDKQPASPTKPSVPIGSLRQGVVAQKAAEAERRLAAHAATTDEIGKQSADEDEDSPEDSTSSPVVRAKLPPGALLLPAYPGLRVAKTRSMVVVDNNKRGIATPKNDESKSSSIPRNWPQLIEGGVTVLKEGQINKTRITENGKKLRKNWAPSHVVLTELFLLFFKDAKSFAAMKAGIQGNSMPEQSVNLKGATIETGEKFSSRKNTFLLTFSETQHQILCQEDNMTDAHSWFHQIGLAIQSYEDNNPSQRVKLPYFREGSPQVTFAPDSPEEKNAINRTKSVKVKKDSGSIEDLTAANNSTEQTKIKARLKKFFVRRPTMESLVKKGIWKDEPAFGSYLHKLCFDEPGQPQVPIFVQRCIAAIEVKPENMRTDGLYRASGNLSQVQKIRLQVDQNNLSVLDQEEDVHVLTGALKLFFRELKEPLIPYDAFSKALKASTNSNKKEKLQQFREIIRNLPIPNHDTLKYLLQHLLRVTEDQASNRMHIPNLAIVFGPTLMWPEEESQNMALDLMQQNIVIESLLQDFDAIFR